MPKQQRQDQGGDDSKKPKLTTTQQKLEALVKQYRGRALAEDAPAHFARVYLLSEQYGLRAGLHNEGFGKAFPKEYLEAREKEEREDQSLLEYDKLLANWQIAEQLRELWTEDLIETNFMILGYASVSSLAFFVSRAIRELWAKGENPTLTEIFTSVHPNEEENHEVIFEDEGGSGWSEPDAFEGLLREAKERADAEESEFSDGDSYDSSRSSSGEREGEKEAKEGEEERDKKVKKESRSALGLRQLQELAVKSLSTCPGAVISEGTPDNCDYRVWFVHWLDKESGLVAGVLVLGAW